MNWLVLLLALPLLAWTQYRTLPADLNGKPQGCGVRWLTDDVPLSLDATPLDHVEDAQVLLVAQKAALAWQQVQCPLCEDSCGMAQTCAQNPLGVNLHVLETRGLPTLVGATCTQVASDGGCANASSNGNWLNIVHNPVLWAEQGQSSSVVAVTVLTYDRQNGEIRDADVLLDDVHHDFCLAPDCPPGRYDLQSTLTHEFGHVLGLDHTQVSDAAMFAGADPGEILKRSLKIDDTTGICTAYRTRCTTCATSKTASCNASRSASAWIPCLLGLCACVLRRRRD